MTLERGVPYWLDGGTYQEDKGWATHTDDRVEHLGRVYLLEERWDPRDTRVLHAETGKVYRVSPEALWRSTVGVVGGEVVKKRNERHFIADTPPPKVVLLPQEWE